MKFELKAGKYIVVDPCYLHPDNEWNDFCGCLEYNGFEKKKGNCSSLTPADHSNGIEMFYKGSRYIVIGTAWGDGFFELKQGRKTIAKLGVDAGLLAVIPLELAESWPEFKKNKHLGHIVEIKYDATLEANGGNFKFAGYSVDTSGEEEDFD